jgi:hypothetical protein
MGIVQDTLLGIRKMTLRDNLLDWFQVQNIFLWVTDWDGQIPPPAILKPKPMWTGKQLLSMCIPKGVNISVEPAKKEDWEDEKDKFVIIDDGQLLRGIINKSMAGTSEKGLVHVIFRQLGHVAARDFFSACQQIVNFWLLHNGFSVSIGDAVVAPKTMDEITNRMAQAKASVQALITEAENNLMRQKPGMTIRETLEKLATVALEEARGWTGVHAAAELKEANNFKQMMEAGSKGNPINISQMAGVVGQQQVDGKRIDFGFRHRTLPHFSRDDYGPESRGFVENSYLRGLTPQEFWFHAMGGRVGLIDTAVKTAETGYIQRRLVKAMEDLKVGYDGTVRNSNGDIIQFLYGEDGMDATAVESQVSLTPDLADDRLSTRCLRRTRTSRRLTRLTSSAVEGSARASCSLISIPNRSSCRRCWMRSTGSFWRIGRNFGPPSSRTDTPVVPSPSASSASSKTLSKSSTLIVGSRPISTPSPSLSSVKRSLIASSSFAGMTNSVGPTKPTRPSSSGSSSGRSCPHGGSWKSTISTGRRLTGSSERLSRASIEPSSIRRRWWGHWRRSLSESRPPK